MTQIIATLGSILADITALITNIIRTIFHAMLQFLKTTFNLSEATIEKILHLVTSFLNFMAHNKTVLLIVIGAFVVYRHFTRTSNKARRNLKKKA